MGKGDADIPGLTDEERPRRLGPKRASKIRKLFGLTKDDDVRKYVVRRTLENGKTKAPKIQRLVTNTIVHRKRKLRSVRVRQIQANREELKKYRQRVVDYKHEQQEKRASEV